MVQNKKIGAGLALTGPLFGMGVSGTASALPEMQVGTMIVSSGASATTADTVDCTVSEPVDVDTEDTAS